MCQSIIAAPTGTLVFIFVAIAGTGIAPFRSFWRRIFYDGIDSQPPQPFSENAMFWLLSGFANTDRWVSSFVFACGWRILMQTVCCAGCRAVDAHFCLAS
jgi:hypothetical protein